VKYHFRAGVSIHRRFASQSTNKATVLSIWKSGYYISVVAESKAAKFPLVFKVLRTTNIMQRRRKSESGAT
jgi:hypothetical protein